MAPDRPGHLAVSMQPKVSVIVPCYNQSRFLPDALDAVCAQTKRDWECVVINDGSPDDTGDVARRYVERDSRFRLICQANCGLAGARNAGLSAARGQFLQFLDADDVIAPNKFERQLSLIEGERDCSVAYCDYRFSRIDAPYEGCAVEDRMSPKIVGDPLEELISRWENELSVPCHCFLFDRRLFSENDIRFDETLENHEDWDCWVRVFALRPRLHFVDEVMAWYRMHPNSMAKNRSSMARGLLRAAVLGAKRFPRQTTAHRLFRERVRLVAKQMRWSGRYGVSARAAIHLARMREVPSASVELAKTTFAAIRNYVYCLFRRPRSRAANGNGPVS